jgi:hypothetical protein
MSNHDFKLKSGENLHVSTAPFEDAVCLVEAVKSVTLGMDPSSEIDDAILANPNVRKALYPCFALAMWGIHKVSPQLFNDQKVGEKARGDYFEICSKIIEVNMKPFFLTLSSKSTTTQNEPTGSRQSP